MHEHGQNCLVGPLRGTRGWWQELGRVSGCQSPPAKKRRRKPAPESSDPAIRKELVERIRREIAAGTYDSPEKWEAALDRLLDTLSE